MVIIMYMETSIIRENKIIADFEFEPNEELSLYLRSHILGKGGDDWFIISNLTRYDVKKIKSLCKSKMEKDLFKNLKAGDSIDILLHFCVYING